MRAEGKNEMYNHTCLPWRRAQDHGRPLCWLHEEQGAELLGGEEGENFNFRVEGKDGGTGQNGGMYGAKNHGALLGRGG